MKAHQGDRIILAASHTDEPTRDGEVLEVRGANGDPPYLVRWADGRTGLMYPGPGSVLRIEGEHVASVPAGTSLSSAGGPAGEVVEPTLPHLREWQVRVSIFESGDDTSANVALLSEAPTHSDRPRLESSRHRGHVRARDRGRGRGGPRPATPGRPAARYCGPGRRGRDGGEHPPAARLREPASDRFKL
jgi:hypothetical protein